MGGVSYPEKHEWVSSVGGVFKGHDVFSPSQEDLYTVHPQLPLLNYSLIMARMQNHFMLLLIYNS